MRPNSAPAKFTQPATPDVAGWFLETDWDGAFAELRTAGDRPSSLAGRPIAIKANIAVRGFRRSAGCAAYADEPPQDCDAPVVAAVRSAGTAIVGTTNMDELAYGFTGRNSHFGSVANPHAAGCISGGSSSGSAAAIAGGMIDIALGTDTNGSIRIPSALCGIWGLRPTSGAVSSRGMRYLSTTLDTPGPMAATAQLLRELASAMGIASSGPVAAGDAVIAVVDGFPAEPATPAMRDAVSIAARALDSTRRVRTAWAGAARFGAQILTASEIAAETRTALLERPHDIGHDLRARLVAANAASIDATEALQLRGVLMSRVADLFDGADVLILPTVPTTAPLSRLSTLEIDGQVEALNPALGRCCIPFSFLGLPALSVPVAEPDDLGLPRGVQLVGRPGGDALLLELACMLESAGTAAAQVLTR
ncbi:amidase [Rhodococcus jostii]|uniref:Aspartyl-tRNA(Asn)/glutamyl-tRNA(Gln) amidotransferase subunit A n=1 Tax=Rhodococcus jostii TaxID=132919 RepID=A0A1H4IVC8_RHOJO|nr:amidase family protein [Rhodococcus jostii]SEB37182.1 aspartyl-tRNA(Asn)/glutamyl-tRNA(Gln) amidotransferase subunit A [Rhodococcus jostii]